MLDALFSRLSARVAAEPKSKKRNRDRGIAKSLNGVLADP